MPFLPVRQRAKASVKMRRTSSSHCGDIWFIITPVITPRTSMGSKSTTQS